MKNFGVKYRSALVLSFVFLLFTLFTLVSANLFAEKASFGSLNSQLNLAQISRNQAARREIEAASFGEQKTRSEFFLMQNLATPGIHPGIVIASPSQNSPNYFYHWVRDAAISFMQIQTYYQTDAGNARNSLQSWMLAHLSLNLGLQVIPNTIAGDAEPKYEVNGTVYKGEWGRPQTDGPALRAISFMHLFNLVNSENWPNKSQILTLLYDSKLPTQSLIKTDLEYVANHWNQVSIDLWEETRGAHFFTLAVQRRALTEGAILAKNLGDTGAAQYYATQAAEITQFLASFWNPKGNYIVTALNVQSGPPKSSLLDTSVLLGALYGDVGDGIFSPYDDRVLATLQVLRDVFQKEYGINQNSAGTMLGRYPEDTYDGVSTQGVGNPWFITTQASAEVYYRLVLYLSQTKQIKLGDINLHFYNSVMKGQMNLISGQTITANMPAFHSIIQALIQAGDQQLNQTLVHRGSDGSLSEQVNRGTGVMQGAVNLTWSHASYLSAMTWRNYISSLIQ